MQAVHWGGSEDNLSKDIISICLWKEQGFYLPAKVTIKWQEWLDSEGLKSALQKNGSSGKLEKDGDKIGKNLPVQHRKDVIPSI